MERKDIVKKFDPDQTSEAVDTIAIHLQRKRAIAQAIKEKRLDFLSRANLPQRVQILMTNRPHPMFCHFVTFLNPSETFNDEIDDYSQMPPEMCVKIGTDSSDPLDVSKNLAEIIHSYFPEAKGLPIRIFRSIKAYRKNRPSRTYALPPLK